MESGQLQMTFFISVSNHSKIPSLGYPRNGNSIYSTNVETGHFIFVVNSYATRLAWINFKTQVKERIRGKRQETLKIMNRIKGK